MSFLDKCDKVDLTEFPGAQQNTDEEDAVQTGALLAQNVEFGQGSVSTRNGFGLAIQPHINSVDVSVKIPSMDNWLISNGNILIYMYDDSGTKKVQARFLTTTNTEFELLDDCGPAVGMMGVPDGKRWFMAFFIDSGLGAIQAQCWDGNNTNGVQNVTALFQRPLLESELTLSVGASALLSGEIALTAGDHNVALVIKTKNGYRTGLSPATSGGAGYIVVGFTFTADGVSAYNITGTPTGDWPNWCLSARVVLTPVSNLNKYYYVPFSNEGAIPTPNDSTPVVIRIACDDETLTASGQTEEVTDLQSLYHPENFVYALAPGSSRMAYLIQEYDTYLLSESTVYVSDKEDPQSITLDQHGFTVPGSRLLAAIAWQGSSLFMFGPNWTYSRGDNGMLPVEWPVVEIVDERIGTRFPKGVLANPTRGYIWVAHESGLYKLTGAVYPELPISWLQGAADWKRINFAAPADTLEVKEFAAERLVIVKAALDGATVATHLLVWNYTWGAEPDKVRYSIWDIANLGPGGLEIVMNQSSKKQEIWLGRADDTGAIYRRKHYPQDDTDEIYDDIDQGIDAEYTGPPAVHDGALYDVVGADIRVRGSGNAGIAMRSLDASRANVALSPIQLSIRPGRDYVRSLRMQTEAASFHINNGAVAGDYFILSRVRMFLKRWLGARS